jgi:hypothetical protein
MSYNLKLGQYITEFVCIRPKSYSYGTNDGEDSVKFKGVFPTFKKQGAHGIEKPGKSMEFHNPIFQVWKSMEKCLEVWKRGIL